MFSFFGNNIVNIYSKLKRNKLAKIKKKLIKIVKFKNIWTVEQTSWRLTNNIFLFVPHKSFCLKGMLCTQLIIWRIWQVFTVKENSIHFPIHMGNHYWEAKPFGSYSAQLHRSMNSIFFLRNFLQGICVKIIPCNLRIFLHTQNFRVLSSIPFIISLKFYLEKRKFVNKLFLSKFVNCSSNESS